MEADALIESEIFTMNILSQHYLVLTNKHNIYTYASSCFHWMNTFCSFATTIKHIDECDRSHILFISLFLISHIRLLTEFV